eukprot:PhF_6_TR13557/c0_g1_i1/m.21672
MIVRQHFNEWSRKLSWPKQCYLQCQPTSQGCGSAFNHVNFIRTALYFQTHAPYFPRLKGFGDVDGMWLNVTAEKGKPETIAAFDTPPPTPYTKLPKIVLENYVDGAQNILQYKWPQQGCVLIVGHENKGVQKETLAEAEAVVYIPQQGTISSLNVVTAFGIALHSLHTSLHTYNGGAIDPNVSKSETLSPRDFSCNLPERNGDLRPLRPILYHQSQELVKQHSQTHKLQNLSVYYENEYDHRNLGGLIRSGNAFGVKTIYYSGKRKINNQGTVGTHLYTQKQHLASPEELEDVLRSHEVWVLRPDYLCQFGLERSRDVHATTTMQHVFLDNVESVVSALRSSRGTGKDVLLAIHQESMPLSPIVYEHASKVVCVVERPPLEGRGLPPAVAGTIALFRLFHVMLTSRE